MHKVSKDREKEYYLTAVSALRYGHCDDCYLYHYPHNEPNAHPNGVRDSDVMEDLEYHEWSHILVWNIFNYFHENNWFYFMILKGEFDRYYSNRTHGLGKKMTIISTNFKRELGFHNDPEMVLEGQK